jgi:long-chain fatty acid transport protein
MKRIVALLAFCAPFFVSAQGFQVSLQGQRQQAMAGAGAANIQDGASLFYNPGGVSFLKKNSLSFGTTPVRAHVQYVDASTAEVSETHSPAGYPFTGYAVFGKESSKMRFGMAAYTPFGSTIDYEKGWTGRFVLTHLQLAAVYLQPTVSYRISNKVGIGAGFVYGIGKVNLQRDIPVTDEKGEYGRAELAGKASGIGFNAGLYYKPCTNFSVGLTHHSKVDMRLKEGTATFTVPASLAASFPSGKFSTDLPLPSITTLGLAYTASPKTTMVFDASYVGWKSFDTLTFDYEKNTSELSDTKTAYNYENAMAFRLGAQYAVSKKFDARAGIKYLTTPVQDGFVTPDVPDAANVNYSVGFGYKCNSRFAIDASFTFQNMERTGTNTATGFTGTYKTYIYMPGISFNYNF